MTFNILIPDNVNQKAIDILSAVGEFNITAPGNMSREETRTAIPDAHAMIIRSSTIADAELIAAATNLRVIARAGVGVDNVELDAATAQNVIVMNTPGGNTISTAEHTFGLMLALARHIPQSDASLRGGSWDRKSFNGVELRGKTLGIIGLGRIGREVGRRAAAFEMQVIGYDPYVDIATAQEAGITKLDTVDEVLAQADFLTLHTVITDDTKGMINTANIAKMKKGVRIINAARGALIDDQALAQAINDGYVAGAALDVYEFEPPPQDHPLVGMKNVIATPHLAASTSDAQINVAIEAAELVRDALLQGRYANVVNQDVLARV
jgi:D-3-phosphoglycerate dehydrogenase